MVRLIPSLITDAPIATLLAPREEIEGEVIISEIYGASIQHSHAEDYKGRNNEEVHVLLAKAMEIDRNKPYQTQNDEQQDDL